MGRPRVGIGTLLALIVLIALPFAVGRTWPGARQWAALSVWPAIIITPFVESRMAKDGGPVGTFERVVVFCVLVTAASLLCFVVSIEIVPLLSRALGRSPGNS